MPSHHKSLRVFGLIQDLQKEAADLGMTRTAAALEVTCAVAMEEISEGSPLATDEASAASGKEDTGEP